MTEIEAKSIIKSILDSNLSTYEIVPFKREPTQIAVYSLKFAVVAKTDEVTQEVIEEIIKVGARNSSLESEIRFEGTEVDRGEDFDTTIIFINAKINARV